MRKISKIKGLTKMLYIYERLTNTLLSYGEMTKYKI